MKTTNKTTPAEISWLCAVAIFAYKVRKFKTTEP